MQYPFKQLVAKTSYNHGKAIILQQFERDFDVQLPTAMKIKVAKKEQRQLYMSNLRSSPKHKKQMAVNSKTRKISSEKEKRWVVAKKKEIGYSKSTNYASKTKAKVASIKRKLTTDSKSAVKGKVTEFAIIEDLNETNIGSLKGGLLQYHIQQYKLPGTSKLKAEEKRQVVLKHVQAIKRQKLNNNTALNSSPMAVVVSNT